MRIDTTGYRVTELEARILVLEAENAQLRARLAEGVQLVREGIEVYDRLRTACEAVERYLRLEIPYAPTGAGDTRFGEVVRQLRTALAGE